MEIACDARALDADVQAAYGRLLPQQDDLVSREKLKLVWSFEQHPAAKGAIVTASLDGDIVGKGVFVGLGRAFYAAVSAGVASRALFHGTRSDMVVQNGSTCLCTDCAHWNHAGNARERVENLRSRQLQAATMTP